jgi:hypothetical protein
LKTHKYLLVQDDCMAWLAAAASNTIHAARRLHGMAGGGGQ